MTAVEEIRGSMKQLMDITTEKPPKSYQGGQSFQHKYITMW